MPPAPRCSSRGEYRTRPKMHDQRRTTATPADDARSWKVPFNGTLATTSEGVPQFKRVWIDETCGLQCDVV